MAVRLFFAVVAGFFAGVFLRAVFSLPLSLCIALALAASGSFAAAVLTGGRAHVFIVCAVGVLALAAGVLRMDAAALAYDPALMEMLGERTSVEGVVFDEPDARDSSVRIPLETESGARILVIAPAHAPQRFGDMVRATGVLRLPERFEEGGRSFDYPGYLATKGITFELAFADVSTIERAWTNPLKAGAIALKERYTAGLSRALPEPHAGLAAGITAGDKRAVSGTLADDFRTVGLSHIVVLSGYNITVVLDALARLFSRFSRSLRLSMGIGVALSFVYMTGGAASSVRAAGMAAIALYGRATGRMYLASRALAFVAFLMVLWNPLVLVYDPGFQLSIIATAGLIALAPLIGPRLSFVPERGGLREIATATIAAQCAVLPLLLYQNGQLSPFALPVNLLVLAFIPAGMLFSFIAGVAGAVLPSAAPYVSAPAYALLSWDIRVADLFASLPFAKVSIPGFSAWWVVLVYVLGSAAVYVAHRRAHAREDNVQRLTSAAPRSAPPVPAS